jgi:hypothetical protein
MGAQRQADSAVIQPDGGAPVPTTTRRAPAQDLRLWAVLYAAAVLSVSTALALRLPDWTAHPMGRMTHYMAVVGPDAPGYPWSNWLLMGLPVVLVYGLILPAALGPLPGRAAQVGVLLLAPVTLLAGVYWLRLGWPVTEAGAWGGVMDWLSVVALVVTPLPVLAAAVVLLARRDLRAWWVVVGGILLHVGMIGGMQAADLLG